MYSELCAVEYPNRNCNFRASLLPPAITGRVDDSCVTDEGGKRPGGE